MMTVVIMTVSVSALKLTTISIKTPRIMKLSTETFNTMTNIS